MLLQDAPLTLREFVTGDELPLASIFAEVFALLARRDDIVVHGAHAVNAWVETERMTQDVDVLTTCAPELAERVRAGLADRFRIAVRVREVVPAVGYRVCQLREGKNRHLVDVRGVPELPPHVNFGGIQVIALVDLLAMKARSLAARRGKEKGLSDRLDLHRLLNAHPELRTQEGPVAQRLSGEEGALAAWLEVVAERIEPDEEWAEDDLAGAP